MEQIRCFRDPLRRYLQSSSFQTGDRTINRLSIHIPKQAALHIQPVHLQRHTGGILFRQFFQAGNEKFKIFLHNRKGSLFLAQRFFFLSETLNSLPDILCQTCIGFDFRPFFIFSMVEARTNIISRQPISDITVNLVQCDVALRQRFIQFQILLQYCIPHGSNLTADRLLQFFFQLLYLGIQRFQSFH